jgi:large subunit ribosomal protein L29
MATKKYLELVDFSEQDLANELKETMAQYRSLKFDHAVKGLDNPLQLKDIRRDVARLKTEMKRREINNMTKTELAKRSKKRARRRL